MFKVKIKQSGGWLNRQIDKQLKQFAGKVSIGVFSQQSIVQGKINLAELATVHEYGSTKRNIPQRSFLQASLSQNAERYRTLIRSQMWQVVQLKASPMQVKHLLGMRAVADVQNYMVTATFTPLKPATIKRKRSSRPLIDTGRLRQSITYKVDK